MPKQQKNDIPKQEEAAVESPKNDPELVVKEDITTLAPAVAATGKKKFDLKAFLKTKKGKVVAVLVALAFIIAALFAVPASRYAVAGLVIKKDVTVELTDSETGKPVSAADVSLGSQSLKTDANGKTTFKNVAVGNWSVASKKNYYQDAKTDTLVPILSNPGSVKLSLVATGRQVPVSVTNKITGKPLAGVQIVANDSTGATAESGEATVVLPADKQTVSATFKINGYNDLTADITVTEQADDKNKFSLTSSGKIYFLSKRTGKVNVMSSNIDGSDPKIVVEGTGKEKDRGTILLASRDWKYLALLASRDSDQQKLYLINTADGTLSVMDEGKDVDFELVGWYNEQFVYTVFRNKVNYWQPNIQSLKSFNASNAKVTTIDSTTGNGSGPNDWRREVISSVYILENQLVYAKHWNRTPYPAVAGLKDSIYSAKPNGDDKKLIKDFEHNGDGEIQGRLYRPQEVYYRVSLYDKKPSMNMKTLI